MNQKLPLSASIVIPAYNEQENIGLLCERLNRELNQVFLQYEVILVDDGSTDSTWQTIKEQKSCYPFLRALRLRRNFGKSIALNRGIAAAKYELIITMDADLQDEPKEIANLVKEHLQGYDVVVGWKKNRKDPLSKRLPSKLFNAITSYFGGIKLHDHNCGLKLFTKKIFSCINLYGDLHRYIPVMAYGLGYKVAEIPVEHHPRHAGTSKFGVERYLHGLVDLFTVLMLTRFNLRPGHFFGGIAVLFMAAGGIALSYLFGVWLFTDNPIGNRPLLLFGIMMTILSFQFFFFGMLSELFINRTMQQNNLDMVQEVLES